MMQVQIVSDLHLELDRPRKGAYQYELPVKAPNLVLIGNTGCTVDEKLFVWLKAQLTKFRLIFYVSGNKEQWGSSVIESTERLRAFARYVNQDDASGTFVYLNRNRYDVDHTLTILGCTLWSHLDASEIDTLIWKIQDFRRISAFNPGAYAAMHMQDLTWLNNTVTEINRMEPHRRIVVFSHYAPTARGTIDPRVAEGHTSAKLVSASATELGGEACWRSGKVRVWGFGHTCWCADFESEEGVRLVANQRGYGERECAGFEPGKVIELPADDKEGNARER